MLLPPGSLRPSEQAGRLLVEPARSTMPGIRCNRKKSGVGFRRRVQETLTISRLQFRIFDIYPVILLCSLNRP